MIEVLINERIGMFNTKLVQDIFKRSQVLAKELGTLKTIKVDYPIVEKRIIKTKTEAKALGYKNEIAEYLPINRAISIRVNTNSKPITCEELTGISDTEYQNKFGIAWNE